MKCLVQYSASEDLGHDGIVCFLGLLGPDFLSQTLSPNVESYNGIQTLWNLMHLQGAWLEMIESDVTIPVN